MTTLTNRIGIATSLLFVSMAMSCDDNDNDNNNSSDPDVQSARDAGDARGTELATQTRTEIGGNTSQVTMQKSASIIHTINDGEIMQANAVLAISNDSDVQDFASMIIRDHEQSNATLDAMLQSERLPVQDNPISAMLRDEAATGTTQLQQAQAGDLPRAYLKMQIQMHQEAFVLVSALIDVGASGSGSGSNGDGSGSGGNGGGSGSNNDTTSTLDQFLRDTQNMIAMHRDDAADRLSKKNDQGSQN